MTPSGVVTEFPIPTVGSSPQDIVAGPDGALWFTENGKQPDRPHHDRRRLHRVPDPDRREQSLRHRRRARRRPLVHREPAPTRSDASRPPASSPSSRSRPPGPARHVIAAGPDGNLWFTEHGKNKIGRITPAGVFTEFPIPTAGASPEGITAGRRRQPLVRREQRQQDRPHHDRRRRSPSSRCPTATPRLPHQRRARRQPLVHRVRRQQDRPDHDRRRHHRVPHPHRPTAGPYGIAAGPDGNLWFTEFNAGQDRPVRHRRRRRRRRSTTSSRSGRGAARRA